jgi:ribosomal protein S17
MAHYVVQFDYTATNSKEVTAKKGDVVFLVDAPPKKQWWKVRTEKGQEGFIPASYLKQKDKKPAQLPVEVSEKPSHPSVDYVRRVRAMYAYSAQRLDELTVKEGDDILVLEEEKDGWFRGVLCHNNVSGWLPLCFTSDVSSSSKAAGVGSLEAPKRNSQSMLFNTVLSSEASKTNVISCCAVVYDFDATQAGQLTLRKGDVLWILEKTNENWWQV